MNKLFLRKPLIPCTLLILLCISTSFIALFSQNIHNNEATVDDLYQDFQLVYNILPGAGTDGILKLRDKTAQQLLSIEGIKIATYYLECPYSLVGPYDFSNFSTIYGTNSIDWFSQNREIIMNFGEGFEIWNEEVFEENVDRSYIPCIVDEVLSGYLKIQAGDELVIAPCDENGNNSPIAPSIELTVEGTFSNNSGLLEVFGIIVPSYTFLNANGLLYNADMLQSFYYYRAYTLTADPSYNHDYQRIANDIETLIKNEGGRFTVQSNSRVLERTVRPVEQKVQTQKLLYIPLACAFGITIIAACIFLCVDCSNAIFIQLLHGEPRWSVWLKMTGSILSLLIIDAAIALCITRFFFTSENFVAAFRYLAIVMFISIITCNIFGTIYCRKNLIKYFQSKEN